MNLAEGIAEYRRQAQDLTPPYLCDDAELVTLFNEAQEEAAIRARLIVAEEEIDIEAGETRYPIPDGMFEIESAELIDAAGRRFPIDPETAADLDIRNPGWRRKTGRPESFVLEDKGIRLGSIPDAEYTLCVVGYRTPRHRP